MNLFGWGSKVFPVEPLAAGCKIEDSYVQCTISEVSRNGLTCSTPTSRIRNSLMGLLDQRISVSIDNTLLDGVLTWYTIEESSFRIGITIDSKDRAVWRKIISGRSRRIMHASARTASV